MLENSILPISWDSPHEKLKVTSVVYKCYLRIVMQNFEWHAELDVIFPIIGKKNNQSSVSDVDQEIPTLRSTDSAGNSVPCFQHFPFTLGLGFLCLHQRLMIDSIYVFLITKEANADAAWYLDYNAKVLLCSCKDTITTKWNMVSLYSN